MWCLGFWTPEPDRGSSPALSLTSNATWAKFTSSGHSIPHNVVSNKLPHIKHLEQCLACGMHSVNVTYYCYSVFFIQNILKRGPTSDF